MSFLLLRARSPLEQSDIKYPIRKSKQIFSQEAKNLYSASHFVRDCSTSSTFLKNQCFTMNPPTHLQTDFVRKKMYANMDGPFPPKVSLVVLSQFWKSVLLENASTNTSYCLRRSLPVWLSNHISLEGERSCTSI